MTTPYQQLEKIFTRLHHLSHLQAITGWDQHTMMPVKGNDARSAALAELSVLMHQQLTADSVGELLSQAEESTLSEWQRANLREMQRQYRNTIVVPEELVAAKSLAGAQCEHAWRRQRQENNWQDFARNFVSVVALSREEAQIRAEATGYSKYDALLDLYEPGMTTAQLDPIFADLKQWLPALLQQIVQKQSEQPKLPQLGYYPVEQQRELSLKVMKILGFDFAAGRLDISVHPFCGGVPEDVRITTRYDESNFMSALMGVIHETGHASYEQNLPRDWLTQPVALARSTAIHESQSLLFEMQLARSNEFLSLIYPLVIDVFGNQDDLDQQSFLRLNHQVAAGLIRIDADEVSYPAHIMLRYDIERALIEGEIEVEQIPELWDEKMQSYLGLSTKGNYRDGCMQDIHWTDGAFGYFPTYTLGAMYAAQLFHSARHSLPQLSESIASGDLIPLTAWLRTHLWQYGSQLTTTELVKQATGEALNPHYFHQHLVNRYC